MRVLVRADGGPQVGLGHLVRSHSLGVELGRRGHGVEYIADEPGGHWLSHRRETPLGAVRPSGSRPDAEAVAGAARDRGCGIVITDGYVFADAYHRALRERGLIVAAIDDLARWHFSCELVINGGLGARRLEYELGPASRLLAGPEYALLRPAFRLARRAEGSNGRVLVCFGGADPPDFTARFAEAWTAGGKSVPVDLVVGSSYSGAALGRGTPSGIKVHQDLSAEELAGMMARCEAALSAAGMTACEFAAVGVPAVVVIASPDQAMNARELAEKKAALVSDSLDPLVWVSALDDLLGNEPRRQAMGRAAHSLVDGAGVVRVADEVCRLTGTA